MKRENASSWNFGLEKEQILDTYSAQLQKSRNFTEHVFGIKKILGEESTRGGPPASYKGGGRAPRPCGPLSRPPMPIFGYMESFVKEKNKQAFGKKLRRHEAEPWRNQSRALAELFCRGHFPPGGGNHHQHHHQWSSHREGVNLHQHLHRHHLLSKPYFISCIRSLSQNLILVHVGC